MQKAIWGMTLSLESTDTYQLQVLSKEVFCML